MSETSVLLDITVALAIALVAGWLAARLRLSPIVGYVVAGIVISPFTPGFSGDSDRLRLLADIGVVLLLFGVGAQFSIDELLSSGLRTAGGAVVQVAGVFVITMFAAMQLGWPRDAAMYAGAAAGMASSTVLVRILEGSGELGSEHGRLALTWSIVQDLSAVVLVVVLAAITSGNGGEALAADVAFAAAKGIAFVAAVLIVGVRVVPIVLDLIAEQRSRELFFVAMALLVLGTAYASEEMGLSLALGAFLAGIVVSESDLSHRVLGELLPTRDIFAVLFFVSAGILVDPGVVRDEWAAVLVLSVMFVIAKPLLSGLILALTGSSRAAVVFGAAYLVPSAEFSFVLAGAGLDQGAITQSNFAVIITATAISILLSAPAASLAHAWADRPHGGDTVPVAIPAPTRLGRHAVVAGYGHTGAVVCDILRGRFEVIVIEEDALLVKEARAAGMFTVLGSATMAGTLERAKLAEARLLIITLADVFSVRLLAERARALNPYVDVIAATPGESLAGKLEAAGVARAVVAEDEVALELARHSLQRFGVSAPEIAAILQRQRARLREGRA